MSIPTKRACDACHRRKVRCNSHQPCGNCSQAGLSCTYEAIPQKKGPKGSRAKVISELRETQKQSDIVQHRQQHQQQQEQHHQTNGNHVYSSPPRSPTYTPTPGILTRELIESCTDYYFFHMYPLMPILHREQLQQIILESASSLKAYCLVTALCAFMLIQPGIALNVSPTVEQPIDSVTHPQMGQTLMNEASRVQKLLDYVENPTEISVVTSFFLFGCAFGLSRHNTAWNHLREATAQAHNLGLQDESTYLYGDRAESSRKRRLFWLLFVTERAYALQKHLPLTLHATISLPTDADTQNSASLAGFIHLVNLYRPFDDTFIGLWNKSRRDCSTLWLAQQQQQLTQALPAYLDTTESQAADLRCSQQWLRTVVWQLSIANGFLSSASQDGCMTFTYPIEIAKDLVTVMSGFSTQSMDIHGIGLVEKIFDVACTLIDVMSCVPPSPTQHLSTNPQTYLNQLLTLISTLRGGESRYLPLAMAKIRSTLPAIIPALPQHLVMKAALHQRGQSLGGHAGSVRSSFGVSDGGGGGGGLAIAGAGAVNGLSTTNVKRESGSSSTSGTSSPYEAPGFLHYYPLA